MSGQGSHKTSTTIVRARESAAGASAHTDPALTRFRSTGTIRRREAADGTHWDIVAIDEGPSKNPSPRYDAPPGTPFVYTREAIEKAVEDKILETAPLRAFGCGQNWWDHKPSVYDYGQETVLNNAGLLTDSALGARESDGGAQYLASAHLSESAAHLKSLLIQAHEMGKAEVFGLSIDADVRIETQVINGEICDAVVEIVTVYGTDIVSAPARGGAFLRAAASDGGARMKSLLWKVLESLMPSLVNGVQESEATIDALATKLGEYLKLDPEVLAKESAKQLSAPDFMRLHRSFEAISSGKPDDGEPLLRKVLESLATPAPAPVPTPQPVNDPPAPTPTPASDPAAATRAAESDRLRRLEAEVTEGRVDRLITRAGERLWESSAKRVREACKNRVLDEAAIQQEINRELDHQEAVAKEGRVKDCGASHVLESQGLTETDRLQIMLAKRLGVTQEMARKHGRKGGVLSRATESQWDGVGTPRSLSRDIYEPWTGDFEMRAEYDLTRVSESIGRVLRDRQAVTQAAFPIAMGEVAHIRALTKYEFVDDGEWRKISKTGPATDFKPNRRHRLGGYGLLQVINAGQAFQDLTTPAEIASAIAVLRRGGKDTIHFEAVRDDNVGLVMQIMDALGESAAYTLAFHVWSTFWGLSGGTINAATANPHSRANFNNTDGTLLSTTLSWENVWAARSKVRGHKQTGSGRRIGMKGDLLVFHSDLEATASGIVESKERPDTTDRATNTLYGKLKPVLCNEDLDDGEGGGAVLTGVEWAIVSSSALPIETLFLDNREQPMIDVNPVDALAGPGFTNFVMTPRVHHIYQSGVVEDIGFAAYVG